MHLIFFLIFEILIKYLFLSLRKTASFFKTELTRQCLKKPKEPKQNPQNFSTACMSLLVKSQGTDSLYMQTDQQSQNVQTGKALPVFPFPGSKG